MGVLTDLFQATDRELAETFRGWKLPPPLLDRAVSKEARNPFTGKSITISSRRDPNAPHVAADPDAAVAPDFRHLPWIDVKGLDPTMLESLGEVLLDWPPEQASGEIMARMLVGPSSDSEESVFVVPQALVQAMAAVSAERRSEVADLWKARDPESRFRDPPTVLLEMLGTFARQAVESGRGVYMWMCP